MISGVVEPRGPSCTGVGCLLMVASALIFLLAISGLDHAIRWLIEQLAG